MKNNFKISVTRGNITNADRRYDYYLEITVTSGKRSAKFIQHEEPAINKRKFSGGITENGVNLWTRHDENFNSDFNFIKIGRWKEHQDKLTEFSNMLEYIKECHGLPIIRPEQPTTITYEVNNGRIEKIVMDETLFAKTYESIINYKLALLPDRPEYSIISPEYFILKMKEKMGKNFAAIAEQNLIENFFEYMEHRKEQHTKKSSFNSKTENINLCINVWR